MKILILLLLFPLLILSCRTPRERAERLVKKANNIFPIDSLVSQKILIDTVIQYDTVVVTTDTTFNFTVPHEKDTIIVVDGKPQNKKVPIKYNKDIIYDDARARVFATSTVGGVSFDILFKKQNIRVKGTVKFQKQIITHRKLVTVTVKTKGFFWWVGLGTTIASAVALIFLSIRSIKRITP